VEEAPSVALDLVREVHAAHMLDPPRGWLDADTFVGEGSWDAALRAAGAAVEAARSALRGEPAFAVVRPPGHHATRGTAMGFCLLNNVAIAANALRRRVAIVDVDVHHGNGTQDVFYERDDVLYASLHGWPLYPGTGAAGEAGRGKGAGSTLNVPLPAGTTDAAWMERVEHAVLPAVRAFRPDVVLVSAGFDADARDPLGNLALSPRSFRACVAALRDVQPRIAAVLEGGYDLDAVREGAAAVTAALE
jgi:acetoin utilization deacetylase AcuC-like enzyme